MLKLKKGIIVLLIVLVLTLYSFPIAALDAPQDVHNYDTSTHELDTEIVMTESVEEITQNSVAGLECLLFGHDYRFLQQWRDGTLAYGSDASCCYVIKEKWIVQDYCTKCFGTREQVAPGAIIEMKFHTYNPHPNCQICTYCGYNRGPCGW